MAVYTKETALYDKDKIHDGIENAGQTASNYITRINSGGIFVHQADAGKSGATPTDPTAYGVHITDIVDIVRAGDVMASFGTGDGDGVRLGKTSDFHANIDADSMTFDDGNGNTFSIDAFYRDGINGGRIIKMIDALNNAELNVQADGRDAKTSMRSSYYDDGSEDSQMAWVSTSANIDSPASVTLHVFDQRSNGTPKVAWVTLTADAFTTDVPIVAPNMDHGTTAATSSIASNNGVTLEVPFNKTFASVPTVVCSLVDVTNGSGGAVDAHQVVASVSTITTTSCKIKIHNNGTQPRKCKISWIAMSD